ncbi:MAG: hypothetical protein P8J70_00065 [Glaciecola sp.]|nr:hypothetical protein [Glaciecola sp.]MDG1816655.1 hypothetical protein [Glaciecola sp.]MDG2098060.1 hypothetical protein [Glaciecola sp.]
MSQHSFDDVPNIRIDASDRSVQSHNPNGTPPPATTVVKASNHGLVISALLLALVSAGAAGYLLYSQQQSQLALQSATARIVELENRLSATGEEMGNSTVALQVKVTELANRSEELWQQMDKLWASAWRRNQSEIKDLTKVVEDNRTQAQSNVNTVTESLNKGLASSDTKFDALQNDFNSAKNEVLSVSMELESIKQGLLNGQDANIVINEKIAILEQRNTALRDKVSLLEKAIASKSSSTGV